MVITIEKGGLFESSSDLVVLYQFQNTEKLSGELLELDQMMDGAVAAFIAQEGFKAKAGERLYFPTFGKVKAKKVCIIGLGEKKDVSMDALRKTGGLIVKTAREHRANRVLTVFPAASIARLTPEDTAMALGEGAGLAAYEFKHHFGTGRKHDKKEKGPKEIVIMEQTATGVKAGMRGLAFAEVLVRGTNYARDLVNTSPRHMTPADLVAAAKETVSSKSGIRMTVHDKEKMDRMGMHAALAVGEGSVHEPLTVHLSYAKRKRPKKRIAIIGKAVTFDSGGLSLKPADAMTNMKIDMAGAATVIGLFKALSELDLPVEVHGVFVAVENMPSGGSYRPGDVVQAMNGMTIEILNTDAEGRVTLADALSYTVKRIKPDVMIDLATLTGAVIVALGSDYVGLMSNDDKLAKDFLKASDAAGESMWQLPLPKQYDDAMKSKVADMNNTGGRDAGAIKAGLFLQRFVDNIPWIHLDIAGPCFAEKETRPDLPYGGTGIGVRSILKFLQSL